jgi:hypothetical protein
MLPDHARASHFCGVLAPARLVHSEVEEGADVRRGVAPRALVCVVQVQVEHRCERGERGGERVRERERERERVRERERQREREREREGERESERERERG